MDFISKNWLVIISLLVALIGGIPGIITVINQRKNRPIFKFSLANLIIGNSLHAPSNNVHTMVLLTGTASNEGNTFLTPAYFELECKLNGEWINFEKLLIPIDAQFQSDIQDIKLVSAWQNDLQRFRGTISTGMPLYGHLMFESSNVSIDQIRYNYNNIELKLICCDIFGKQHKTPLELKLNAIDANVVYPKHGLTVSSKGSKS